MGETWFLPLGHLMILVGKADDKQFRSMTGSRVIHKVLDNEGVYRSKTRIRSRRFSFE